MPDKHSTKFQPTAWTMAGAVLSILSGMLLHVVEEMELSGLCRSISKYYAAFDNICCGTRGDAKLSGVVWKRNETRL